MQLGLSGVLVVIFVLAKLGGYLDWSWWWVFSPIWIGLLITILLVMIIAYLRS